LPRFGADKIEDRGGPARRCRRRTGEEIIRHDGSHHRQLHVGMWVDPAGHHVTASGIDDLGAGRRFDRVADRGDTPVAGEYVGAPASLRSHGRAASN
jgi:hypothetical protein